MDCGIFTNGILYGNGNEWTIALCHPMDDYSKHNIKQERPDTLTSLGIETGKINLRVRSQDSGYFWWWWSS